MPTDPPHTNPVLNGMCTPAAGLLVCQSGVCDPADSKCGFANGDGPCTMANAGTVCRSGVCNASSTCGEDAGHVPPDAATLKCEAAVAKAAAKLWGAIAGCHKKAAAAALGKLPFDEEACEVAAKAKFDKTLRPRTVEPDRGLSASVGGGAA